MGPTLPTPENSRNGGNLSFAGKKSIAGKLQKYYTLRVALTETNLPKFTSGGGGCLVTSMVAMIREWIFNSPNRSATLRKYGPKCAHVSQPSYKQQNGSAPYTRISKRECNLVKKDHDIFTVIHYHRLSWQQLSTRTGSNNN